MSAVKTEQLDSILYQARILKSGLDTVLFNHDLPLWEIIEASTDYFIEINRHKQFIDYKNLDSELRDWFISQPESKLQDRFGNYLIGILKDFLRPLLDGLETIYEMYIDQNFQRTLSRNQIRLLNLNGVFCSTNKYLVERWIWAIYSNVKTFAPELYQEHRSILDKMIISYDEYGDHVSSDNEPIPTTEKIQPIGKATKLQWKGDKTDLAELIWTLSKSDCINDISTGQLVTQKELVNQFLALFGLDSLDVASLMKGRYGTATKSTSYKVKDGKTFINRLQTLLDQRVLD